MGGGKIADIKLPSLQDVSDFVRDTVSAANTNVERNVQNIGSGLAVAASGNFTNFDRTLLDILTLAGTGGMVNPDDVGRVSGKETAVQRIETEAQKAAAEAEAQAIATAESARLDELNTFITKQIAQRTATPGRAQTLLTQSGGGTLLTRI